MVSKPTAEEKAVVEPLVQQYLEKKHLVLNFQESILGPLNGSKELKPLVHSIRSRLKDPDHLRDKLLRKLRKRQKEGKGLDITPENLLTKITDLGGIRVLHLHTKQVEMIDKELKNIFIEYGEIKEGPFARTWDDESRAFFKGIGFQTEDSPTMYTSVHYVLASKSQTTVTCEVQVRTLMEEVWGEVDHTINYPHPSDSVPCVEQIRALARATSTATRLVDSIFATVDDIKAKKKKKAKKAKPVAQA